MKNIQFKAKKLVEADFTQAIANLQRTKMPMMTTKRFKKILEVIVKEQKEYINDSVEQREEIFGKNVSDEVMQLILSVGTADEAKALKTLGWSKDLPAGTKGDLYAEFMEKYEKYDRYCKDSGDTDIDVPFPKLLFPDTFEFPYNMTMALKDLIHLEE